MLLPNFFISDNIFLIFWNTQATGQKSWNQVWWYISCTAFKSSQEISLVHFFFKISLVLPCFPIPLPPWLSLHHPICGHSVPLTYLTSFLLHSTVMTTVWLSTLIRSFSYTKTCNGICSPGHIEPLLPGIQHPPKSDLDLLTLLWHDQARVLGVPYALLPESDLFHSFGKLFLSDETLLILHDPIQAPNHPRHLLQLLQQTLSSLSSKISTSHLGLHSPLTY